MRLHMFPAGRRRVAGDVTGELGRRERQIIEIIYRRGRATAAEVRADLPDDPSYSTVRGMLRHLEGKGYLRHEQDGLRYVYLPTSAKTDVRASALSHVVRTFFDGSMASAAATLFETKPLTQAEYEHLSRLLNEAPREDEA
jgi:BlaI family penicillinase repressor